MTDAPAGIGVVVTARSPGGTTIAVAVPRCGPLVHDEGQGRVRRGALRRGQGLHRRGDVRADRRAAGVPTGAASSIAPAARSADAPAAIDTW